MKRGVTYIVTLVSIGLLYFGSLYVVSRPSTGCVTSLVDGKSELMNREAVENGGAQVPLSGVDTDKLQSEAVNESIVAEDTPSTEYTIVDIKPSCAKLPPTAEKKEKAVIVVLVRNNELGNMRRTMRQFEE
jgi:hypothetical protein